MSNKNLTSWSAEPAESATQSRVCATFRTSRYENGKTKPPVALVKLFKVLRKHPDLFKEVTETAGGRRPSGARTGIEAIEPSEDDSEKPPRRMASRS